MVRFMRQLPLRVLPIEFPAPPRPIGVLTLKNRMVSPLAEGFLDCARDLARSPPPALASLGKSNAARPGEATFTIVMCFDSRDMSYLARAALSACLD